MHLGMFIRSLVIGLIASHHEEDNTTPTLCKTCLEIISLRRFVEGCKTHGVFRINSFKFPVYIYIYIILMVRYLKMNFNE